MMYATKLALLSGLVLLGACKTPGNAELDDTLTKSSELESAMKDNLFGLCLVVEDTAKTKGEEACHAEIIEGICSQQTNTIDDAIKSLSADDVVKNFVPVEKRNQLASFLKDDFKQAVDRCLNAQVYRNIATNQAIANDPERKKRAAAGKIKFWKSMLMSALFPALYAKARVAAFQHLQKNIPAKIILNKDRMLAVGTPTFIKQMTLGVACKAGASVAEWFVLENKPDMSRSECSKVTEFDGNRMRSCFRSIGSACMAGAGFVNLREIPGIDNESQAVNFLNDIASLGLETTCRLGGPVSAAACGTINAAAAQIMTYWQTGTNDWAECTVNPLARCIGEWWGKGSWTNDNGVESPRMVTTKYNEKWWVKGCCLCERVYYESRPFAMDALKRNEWNLGVIQKGDFESGNCAENERQTFKVDEKNYYTYQKCRRVEVVGARCALQYVDDENNFTDVTQFLWNDSGKYVGKKVSRSRGIHD